MSPIGLLGGSFDPVHRGHLQLAADAAAQLALAEVRFVVAGQPWQKGQMTAATHRAAMVALAIANHRAFRVDRREIDRTGATYTIDTLRELRAELGAALPLVLIMGSDQFARLNTWRDWTHLLDHTHLAVARRNDAALVLPESLQEFYNAHWTPPTRIGDSAAGHVTEVAMTPVDESATKLRELLALSATAEREAALQQRLPEGVLDYIRGNHLYC
jgi:nicotinate-nucleotide adenylyltransferase